MLIWFFVSQGVVHKEFEPQEETVDERCYSEVLERMKIVLTVSGQRFRTLGCCITTTLPVTLPSPWKSFWTKRVFQWFRSPLLAWSESMWLLAFLETQIPPQRSSFLNCGQHPKVQDRPADGTSTWRLPALLPAVVATSPAVCGFPTELLWRG